VSDRLCVSKQIKCRLWKTNFVMPVDAKKPRFSGAFFFGSSGGSSDLGHIRGLRSFLALNNFELDLIALGEGLETGSAYRAEMHEDIGPTFTRNESESFGVVEPFDRTRDACHLPIPLSAGQSVKPLPSELR
jgi:hypothetical protein